MKKFFFCLLSGILLFSPLAFAQETGQQFQGFNLQGYTEGGQKSWDVKGDKADVLGDKVTIMNVNANRYGDQNVNLKAKTGEIDKASGNVDLRQDVVITSQTGTQLKTDTLKWEKEKDLVSTSDTVVITDNTMTATGTGLKAQPGLMTAQMDKDVTVKVKTEPKNPDSRVLNVTCDGPMEIDQKLNKGTFNKNVVAVQDGQTLKADRVEIYFEPGMKQVKQLICIGNVEVIKGENSSYSDRAVYDAVNQTVTLTGKPKLILVTEGEGGISSFKK